MTEAVAEQFASEGSAALRNQPLSGVPFKVYVRESARNQVPTSAFLIESLAARGSRILLVSAVFAIAASCCNRLRRFYPLGMSLGVIGFSIGLARVVGSWS